MSEERPQHTQEPAEGAEDAEEAPGFDRAGDDVERQEDDEQRSVEQPQEPAEGAEEAEEAPGAERAEGPSDVEKEPSEGHRTEREVGGWTVNRPSSKKTLASGKRGQTKR